MPEEEQLQKEDDGQSPSVEIIEEAYEAEEMESNWESDMGASQDDEIYDAFG